MSDERFFPVPDPLGLAEAAFRKLFPEAKVVPRDILSLLSEQKPEQTEPKPEGKAGSELSFPPTFAPVSQLDTVEYQKKEITKALALLEGHLRQGGYINGKPCDCISKHMVEVEALADETAGITGEGYYQDIASWARQHSFKGLPQAVNSGKYRDEYLDLAGQARVFRKQIMGAEIPSASKEAIKAQVQEFIRLKEGKS